MKSFLSVAVMVTGMMIAPSVGAATLTPGYNTSLLSADTVGTRYRSQATSNEHYVGVNDLGVGSNRSEAGHVWVPGLIDFAFSYNSLSGLISSTLGTNTITFDGTKGLVSNALKLTLSNQSKKTAVFTVSDLEVNGDPIADLMCASYCDWMVTDFPVLSSLNVTGKINFEGIMDFNDQERVKFEITSSAITPVPLPAAGLMLLTGIGGLVVMRRKRPT